MPPYHKNAPQIENNTTFTMNEERKQQQHHQQQQQQQLQHQQRVQHAVQEQKHHPHLHHHQQQQSHHHHQQQQQHQQSQAQYQPQQQHHHHQRHQQQQQQQQHSQQVQHQRPPVYQNENVSQQQRQEPQTSLQQQQKPPTTQSVVVKTENSDIPAPPAPAASTSSSSSSSAAVTMAEEKPLPISLANIKSEPKPLNFPRRKLQTERSSTLPICQRCKQVFLKRQNYAQHVALSTCSIVEYDFKCSICPMSFMSNEELQAHEQLHRSNRYFCQKYCGKYYETIDECEHHEFGQHEYEMFKCNICCVSFAKRDQLFSHLVDHRQQPRYDCCICRLCFQDLLELEDHYVGNPDFCGKFYDKEGRYIVEDITSMKTPGTARLPSKQHQHLHQSTSSALHRTHSSSPSTSSAAAADNYDDIPDFAAPHVEIKTEIKVEPDFYPPMDQSDFGNFDDYSSNSQEFGSNSNQNLTFLQDYHESSSTNSSFSFNLQRTTTPTKKSSKNSEAIQDEDAFCCVPKCGVRKFSSPTLNFFPFPRDEKYLIQWCHNLKMTYDPNVNYGVYRVCSLHFPKRCIARYSLSYWAVPTFNLGHDDVGNLYQNRESSGGFPSGEMARCYMPGCLSQRGETNVKFHVFPRDLKTLIKWCQNSRLPIHSKENRFFCSRHFEEKCFGKFRLKPWAIPTLRLGTVYGKIHDNPNIYQEEKKCFLPFCRRSRSYDCNLSLYRFPRDETLLRRWCYNLRLDPDMYRGKNHKICSSHFVKEALGLRKLNPGAVPTMNLGHNDTFDIYENELYTPPPPPSHSNSSQASTSSKAKKFAELLKQQHDMGDGGSSTSIYDEVFMNSMATKISSLGAQGTAQSNVLDLGDVCLVPTCKRTRHTDNITLHTVPKRPEQLKKWCHNLKMDLDKLHKSVRICSAHFESYCIGGCMRPFAVPTLELGHDDPNIYRNPDVIKKLNIRETCCVPTCKRNRDRDHANLHRFPTHPELLQKWCENLHKPVPDGTKLFNDAVCEVHFEDRCLRNKRLEKWAIPTINLGYEDVPHQLPTEEEVAEHWTKPFAPNNGDEQGECCVSTCRRNPQVDDIKLYRPPEDAEQLLKWAHNLQVDAGQLPLMKICNLHFESHCIGKRLLNWAMPTLNLASKVEHLFENPPPTQVVYKKKEKPERMGSSKHDMIKWSPRCCLPHCRKTRVHDNVQLFRFPYANRQTLAKWCHNIQLPLVGSSHRRICSSHFEPSVLTKRCPMNFAVPTLNLNTHPGYKIYQNPARLKQPRIGGTQRQCVVETCRKTRADGVVLFRFPNNRVLMQKWRHNIKNMPKGRLTTLMRVCSDHFEPHSVGGRRISPGAVPTLKLGHDSDDLYPNEKRSYFDLEKCVVKGCDSRKGEDMRLYRFPRDDEEVLAKWCHNLKMTPNDCVGVRICYKHFEAECQGPKLLYKWAVPTLHLGHSEDDEIEIIQNPPPDQRSGEYIYKCCVPNCGKTRKYDDAQMNSFPKHLKLFRKWKHNLKLDFLDFKEREKYKICNDHFEPICVGKTRLNFGAIPTINLGHDEYDDLYKINPDRIRPNLFIKKRDIEQFYNKTTIRKEVYDDDVTSEQNEAVALKQVKIKKSLDIIKCYIPSCRRSRLKHGVRFYSLPSHEKMRRKWLHNLQIPSHKATKLQNIKVCNLHFHKRCLDGKTLKPWAMPTMHLGHAEPIFDNPRRLQNMLMLKRCHLKHCKNHQVTKDDLRTFVFPKLPEYLEKWAANLKLDIEQCKGRLCHEHFEEEVIGEKKLKNGAVPTINLGHDDQPLPYDNKELLQKLQMKSMEGDGWDSKTNGDGALQDDEANDGEINEEEDDDDDEEEDDDENYDEEMFDDEDFEYGYLVDNKEDGDYDDEDEEMEVYEDDEGNDSNDENENDEDVEEEPEEEEVEEEEEEIDLSKIRIRGTSQHWSSLNLKELRVSLVPLTQEDILDMSSRSSFGRDHGSITPASSYKDLRAETPASYNGGGGDGGLLNSTYYLDENSSSTNNTTTTTNTTTTSTNNITTTALRTDRPINSIAPRCCLKYCGREKTPDQHLTTYGFPKDPQLLQKWCDNLGLQPEECIGRVCIDHFELRVIGTRRLKPGAVPTLKLGPSRVPQHNNDDISKVKSFLGEPEAKSSGAAGDNEQILTPPPPYGNPKSGRQSVFRLCCLKHCRRKKQAAKMVGEVEEEEPIKLYKFPLKHPEQLKKWCINVGIREDTENLAKLRLCSNHFESYLFRKNGQLKPKALPTLDLNESQSPPQFCVKQRRDKHISIANKTQCSLEHCKRRESEDTFFIEFPQHDKNLQRKWCFNLKLGRKKLRYYQIKLCNHHFEACAFYKEKHIRNGAVPTINLGHNGRIIRNAPKIRRKAFRTLSSSEVCCVGHCRQKEEDGVKLFPFPKNFELRHTWCSNLQIDLIQALNGHYKVCAEHFTKEIFVDETCKDLKIDAIPTLKLSIAGEDGDGNSKTFHKPPIVEFNKDGLPCCFLTHCRRQEDLNNDTFLIDFPQATPNTLRKWCRNLKLSPKLENYDDFKICNYHFEKRAFKEDRQIKRGMLPTINLGHTDGIIKNISRREHKCCVSNCKNLEKYKRYSFPKDKHLRQLWFRKLKINRKEITQRPLKVCRQHFSKTCFVEGTDQLKENAVPHLKRQTTTKIKKEIKEEGNDKEEDDATTNIIISPKVEEKNEEEADEEKEKVEKPQVFKIPLPPQTTDDDASNKPHCCLAHCAAQDDPNTKTFLISFPPRGSNMRRKWCINLKLGRSSKHDDLKICNHHFETYAFYKQRNLKAGAVPTLNLGHSDRIIKNDAKLRRKVRHEPKDVCCITTCPNRDSPNHLFAFPKNSELRRIWSNNLQIPLRLALSNHYKLCERHFKADSFELGSTNTLRLNAVPSVELGIKDEDNQKVLIKMENEEDCRKCVVESCKKSSSVDKVKLFKLPKSEELLKKWLHNLNLPQDIDIESTRICQRHFEKVCLKQGILHENAIPTQCLKAKSWFYQNDDELYEEKVHKCCVQNCNYQENNDDESSVGGGESIEDCRKMFKFPKQREDIDKWLFNLKLNYDEHFLSKELRNLRVCSHHFDVKCLDKQQTLLMGSVPTLHLGHNDLENIHSNDIQKCCIVNCSYWLNYQCFKLAVEEEGVGGGEKEKVEGDRGGEFKQKCLQVLKSLVGNNDDVEYMCCVHFICYYEELNCAEIPRLRQLYENLRNLPELQCFRCSVPKCKTGFNLNIQLFKFPKDESLLQKWLHNSSVEFAASDRSKYRICALHFENRCFSEKKLHRWSLPTLALPYNVSLYVNPPEALPSHHENLKHCCVSSCNTDVGPFFKFPTKSLEIRKWIYNLNLGSQQCTLNLRVCYLHFESYCLTQNEEGQIVKLKNWAVPTLNLGDKPKPDLHQNPQYKVDMFVCCICQELQNKAENLHLFRFPSRMSVFLKWLNNLKITRNQYRPSMRICVKHFENDCFDAKLKILRRDSVPTLGVQCPQAELFRNPKRNSRRKCCVSDCKGPWSHLYTFPKDKILLKKWYFNLKIKQRDVASSKKLKICERHFEQKCLNAFGVMRAAAVPTLNLGHTNRIFKNPLQLDKVKRKVLTQGKEIEIKLKNKKTLKSSTKNEEPTNAKKKEETKEVVTKTKKLMDTVEQKEKDEKLTPHVDVENTKKSLDSLGVQAKPKRVVKSNLNDTDFLDDEDKPLVNFIKVRAPQQQKKPPPAILENTKKRKIAKKFLPVKPEPENKPLFEIITPEMELERNETAISASLPKLHSIKKEAFLGFEISEITKKTPKIIKYDCSYPECKQNKDITKLGSNPKPEYQKELEILNKAYKEISSKCKFVFKRCMVPGCNSDLFSGQTNADIRLHHFPTSPQQLARKWCHNFDMDYDKLDKSKIHYYKVCSRHFESYCYNARSIYSWAIPTLNLPHNKKIFENNAEDECAYTGQCCVATCVNSNGLQPMIRTRLFKFPSDPERLSKWLNNVKCENFQADETKICGLHFRYKYLIKQKRLSDDAIPTLKLGLTNENDEELAASSNMNIVIKEELLDYENVEDEQQQNLDENTTYGWNDHDYCFETAKETNNIAIKQELIEDQYGLEETHQQQQQSQEMLMFSSQTIKEEIIEIDETEQQNYDNCYQEQQQQQEVDEEETQNSQVEEQKQHFPPLIISEVKSHIYLCCVAKCTNTSESRGIKLYTDFPSDSEIFIKWCFNLKIDPRNYKENQYAICSEHFEAICFSDGDLKLHSWSVPTLNLNLPDNSFIHHNDPPSEQCLVYGCIQPLMPLYKFPLRLDLCQKWFVNLKLDFNQYRVEHYRICRRHFAPSCFDVNYVLKTEAIPTLFLGHNDPIQNRNDFEQRDHQQQHEEGGNNAPDFMPGLLMGAVGAAENSRGSSSQGSLARHLISPNDLEDHDSSYFEDFEECYGQDE
ncbi:uncharacterized protein LOC133326084 [Musca vetustissima]|uniref:uncharacterized protein LOC133326084 n=1 Tax=Musca vetustissima TaxID=27455 RepID=UPI002AB70283|nr:uncharacterized protein LOC133326084 [Musca vetustissima]